MRRLGLIALGILLASCGTQRQAVPASLLQPESTGSAAAPDEITTLATDAATTTGDGGTRSASTAATTVVMTDSSTTTSTSVASVWTTSTAVADTSTTGPARATSAREVLRIDVPLRLGPLVEADPCPSLQCFGVASTVSGDPVLLVPSPRGFVVFAEQPRTVELAEPLTDGSMFLVAIGPDDVAYVAVDTPGAVDPIGDLLAVSLAGANAGQVVARVAEVLDMSGDTDLAPARAGLVEVGCCGAPDETERPDPEREPVMRWVDRSGNVIVDERPQVSLAVGRSIIEVVRRDGSGEVRWTVPAPPGSIRGMPLLAARADGGVAMAFDQQPEVVPLLFVFKPDGAVEEIVIDRHVVGLIRGGTEAVFFDSGRVAQAALPTYTAARDALPELLERFADEDLSGSDPDEVIARVVAALSRADGCEVQPTAGVAAGTGGDPVAVTIDHRFGCDDSAGGVRYELTIGSAVDPINADHAWSVQNATARTLCLRGGGPDFCV